MEHKTDSLWWTSGYKAEDGTTLHVGSGGETLEMPFVEVLDLLGLSPSKA